MELDRSVQQRTEVPRYLRRYAAQVDGWRQQSAAMRPVAATARPSDGQRSVGARDLELALARGELQLAYQPWMNMTTGSYAYVEALARWHHPELGLIGPDQFIPLAERTGLIGTLGAWVIDAACRQLRAWRDAGGEAGRLRMAVNLSPHQLSDPGLPATVGAALATNRLEPNCLCLEITESAVTEDEARGLANLTALRRLGVSIAIDDFGTGHSSLARLRQLPVDVLKVPRELLLGVDDDPRCAAILTAVAELARAVELQVVAEGVETLWQAIAVRALGIDHAQGYYFARPCDGTDIPAVVLRSAERECATQLPRRPDEQDGTAPVKKVA
jgi:diguanylate cyclase